MIQIQKIKHRNTEERNIQIHTCPEPTNLRYKYNKLDIIIRLLREGLLYKNLSKSGHQGSFLVDLTTKAHKCDSRQLTKKRINQYIFGVKSYLGEILNLLRVIGHFLGKGYHFLGKCYQIWGSIITFGLPLYTMSNPPNKS